jgi:hypothetical protein
VTPTASSNNSTREEFVMVALGYEMLQESVNDKAVKIVESGNEICKIGFNLDKTPSRWNFQEVPKDRDSKFPITNE